MDEVPSSKPSPDEVSASKLSPLHESKYYYYPISILNFLYCINYNYIICFLILLYVTDVVAEDHAENKGAENKGTDDSNDRGNNMLWLIFCAIFVSVQPTQINATI